jgi:hypothetical protein
MVVEAGEVVEVASFWGVEVRPWLKQEECTSIAAGLRSDETEMGVYLVSSLRAIRFRCPNLPEMEVRLEAETLLPDAIEVALMAGGQVAQQSPATPAVAEWTYIFPVQASRSSQDSFSQPNLP